MSNQDGSVRTDLFAPTGKLSPLTSEIISHTEVLCGRLKRSLTGSFFHSDFFRSPFASRSQRHP